jgi:hypothetical protein
MYQMIRFHKVVKNPSSNRREWLLYLGRGGVTEEPFTMGESALS